MDNPGDSYQKSQKTLEYSLKIMNRLFGPEHYLTVFFTGHIRKIAHFAEYMLLGITVSSCMAFYGKIKIQHIYNSLSFAVITAVIDEYIQLYTYRGSSVRDVVIDFSGYFFGTVISAFIISLIVFIRLSLSKTK
ncbi:MAG: VanZ family protein [Oscillospiraceae bacterium]|nr:VanZ family protein [Oscillospiraceae bacterium]